MGYVYILTNKAMPGLIKIGCTTKSPEERVTRIGVFHIEEAILDTLFQAGSTYMRAADIPHELGISQSHDKTS